MIFQLSHRSGMLQATLRLKLALVACLAGCLTFHPLAGRTISEEIQEAQAGSQPEDSKLHKELIAMLHSPDPVERADAASRLSLFRPSAESISALGNLLGDRSPVADLPGRDPRRSIIVATDPGRQAALTLGSYGQEAVEQLAASLQSDSSEMRHDAAFGLGLSKSKLAAAPLIAALGDSEWKVRKQAAKGLGFLADSSAVQPLLGALQDDHAEVREKAAQALGSIKDPGALKALIDAALFDQKRQVRKRAVAALGQIGDPRAWDALSRIEKDRSESRQVRSKARWALAMLGSPAKESPDSPGESPSEPARTATRVETLSGEYPLSPRQNLQVRLEYGSLSIQAADSHQVEARIQVECYASELQCQELLSQVRIEPDASPRSLRLSLRSPLKNKGEHQLLIKAALAVPRFASLQVDSKVGNVRIQGLEEDMNVDLGIGDVEVEVPRSKVSRVELNADMGGTKIQGQGNQGRLRKRNRNLSGSDLKWSGGLGDAGVVVHVGIGSISVHLQPH